MKEYNIGLDIGTTSVGWAVVEANNQKVMKKGNKYLWGVRLFDEASTAEERRKQRSTRRRYDRRRERIKLLQKEFLEEINKVDKDFFDKLKESKYQEDDLINKKIKLKDDEKNKIKEYYKEYKTIYHLRERLINDDSKEDIRLIYLAIHHIIKYRGNFLYNNPNFNIENLSLKDELNKLFNEIVEVAPELNIPENYKDIINIEDIANVLLKKSLNDIKVELKEKLKVFDSKKFIDQFIKAVNGYKFSIVKMFDLDEKDISISLTGDDFEKNYNAIEELIGEKISIINLMKELYDTIFLKKLFKGKETDSLSSLMVNYYDDHKEDLKLLKTIFKVDRNIYKKIFKTKKEKCLYDKYISNNISKEEFVKEINNYLEKIEDNELINNSINLLKEKINNDNFLPRITSVENGKYPYQLNKDELIKIIENQGKYYPFLLKTTSEGTYKIVKLLEFRIPYYVGPLVSSKKSDFAWLERKKENIKITPYNFEEVVDKDKTAEKFIERMISHCTYLFEEYALPNNSILYSEFKVLNELKQIRVNGVKLTVDQVKETYQELFCNETGNITEKKFKEFLINKNWYHMYDELQITGYSADKKFANNMQSFVDFFGEKGIFKGTNYNIENAETIIKWVTIFEDKDILKRKLMNEFSEFNKKENKEKLENILKKNYSGWGKLSEELLKEITYKDKATGIEKSIIDLMRETKENFIQILNNDEYKFQDKIKEINGEKQKSNLSYNVVKELATSPATKKGIYQALKVVKELVNYIGYEPKNISIEMSRENDKKERKDDRKTYLNKLYDNSKSFIYDYKKLNNELNNQEKIDEKIYLYFIQEGKCLYCGNHLNIDDLTNCEVDHIIPRTLVKDNSWDNKALVHREHNQDKKDSFVIPKEYRTYKIKKYWERLKKINLISAKKYYHLTKEEFKDEDIQNFINRQLVETRQITKHVANILSNYYKKTNVIYLKATLSSDYRQKFELFKYRSLNDYHHVHDAYLAAVLGEYKENYFKRKIDFELIKELNLKLKENSKYKDLKYGFVINSLDPVTNDVINDLSDYYIDEETGEVLFDVDAFNKRVEDTLYRNDILISRKTEIRTGMFYKQTIYPAGVGRIPIKENMPVEKYGGYNDIENGYLILVEYDNTRRLIGIPIKTTKDNYIKKLDFIKSHLGTKKFKILKDKIPFETMINYKGQLTYIKGYGNANKDCTLSNAFELKISKELMKKWKYTLNKIINEKNIPIVNNLPIITEEEMHNHLIEILNYLFSQKNNFVLFENIINKIENNIDINRLSDEKLIKIIIEILKMFKCTSDNANLKDFGLSSRLGMLNGKVLTTGTLIFKSTTGIKERRYEF